MRYAVIADIHANLIALTAVLDDIEQRGGVDRFWCLGDIVGYGPEPRGCLALLREKAVTCVAGNHDLAAIGKVDTAYFNHHAAVAAHWTAKQLDSEDISYLSDLPLVVEQDNFTLVHGSPEEPLYEYLVSREITRRNLASFRTQFCLVGHSHQPVIFSCDAKGDCSKHNFQKDVPVRLGEEKLIINPGGVGHPRDGDPWAAYAIYDTEQRRVELLRVPYDINDTQEKILAYGLPGSLSVRLGYGI